MEIIKNKRVSECRICRKPINQKYKVLVNYGWGGTTKYYYHLSCYLNRLKKELEQTKQNIKKFSKQKFKRVMILENL